VTRLAPDEGTVGDEFGNAVALDGNWLVVGAQMANAAYIYERTGSSPGSWNKIRRLTASDAPGNGYFGNAVAIASRCYTKLFS